MSDTCWYPDVSDLFKPPGLHLVYFITHTHTANVSAVESVQVHIVWTQSTLIIQRDPLVFAWLAGSLLQSRSSTAFNHQIIQANIWKTMHAMTGQDTA